MRKLMLPAAAAALALVALDAAPASAQVIINSGYYAPGYYGASSPYPYGGGLVIGAGGIGYGTYPAYPGFGYPGYGARPYHGGGYSPYHGGYSPYYGAGYRTYYGGGYGYPGSWGGYRGGWRR